LWWRLPFFYCLLIKNTTIVDSYAIIDRMFQIMTHDTRQRALWLRLFGTETLPVKAAKPRWRVERGAFGREVNVLAYDLDARRLHWMARQRFASWVSVKTGHTVRASEVDGWLIKADRCEVINETADSSMWGKRPFSFFGNVGIYANCRKAINAGINSGSNMDSRKRME